MEKINAPERIKMVTMETKAVGQNQLGLMYGNGLGVPQDYAEAVNWYRKAAEQGYAQGQFNLGLMYRNGLEVSKDIDEAIKWYRKAAAQGNSDAQEALAQLTQQ